MKIVVIGGSGMIGKQVVALLTAAQHEVIAASPLTGVNTITGEGLDNAFTGADVVIDVINNMDMGAVVEFFQVSGRNLRGAAIKAGIKHVVILSIVGTPLLTESPYFQAKQLQENIVQDSGLPYTIVRATQFYESLGPLAEMFSSGDTIRVTPAIVQPMASRDIAAFLAQVAQQQPVNGVLQIGGPEKLPLAEAVKLIFKKKHDRREVVADEHIGYAGLVFTDSRLSPDVADHTATQTLPSWLEETQA